MNSSTNAAKWIAVTLCCLGAFLLALQLHRMAELWNYLDRNGLFAPMEAFDAFSEKYPSIAFTLAIRHARVALWSAIAASLVLGFLLLVTTRGRLALARGGIAISIAVLATVAVIEIGRTRINSMVEPLRVHKVPFVRKDAINDAGNRGRQ